MSINPGRPRPTSTQAVGQAVSIPVDRTTELQTYINEYIAGSRTSIPAGEYYTSSHVRAENLPAGMVLDLTGVTVRRFPGANYPWGIMFYLGSTPEPSYNNTEIVSATTLVTSLSVTRGQTVLNFNTTGVTGITSGTYLVLRSTASAVPQINSGLLNYPGHELTRVTSINSSSIVLDAPIRRTQSIEVRRLNNQTGVLRNITLRGGTFFGWDGFTLQDQLKLVYAGCADGLTIENVSVHGFRGEAISLVLSRNFVIRNNNVGWAPTSSIGYGIQVNSSTSGLIDGYVFSEGRTATLFAGGCSDITIRNARSPLHRVPGQTQPHNYDLGHGMRNQYLTLDNCVGGRLSFANPSWQGGGSFGTVTNSTFSEQILIYGGANNITISGRHPEFDYTTTEIFFGSDFASAFAGSYFIPGPVNFNNCIFRINTTSPTANSSGLLIRMGANWQLGGTIVPSLPASTVFTSCQIIGSGGTAPGVFVTESNHGQGRRTYFCMNSCTVNYPTATSSLFRFGTNSASTILELRNSSFVVPNSTSLITLNSGCSAISIQLQNCTFNGTLVTSGNTAAWLDDKTGGSGRDIIFEP